MTPERRQLVTETWKSLAPNAAEVGAIFYRRLFEIDPSLRPLFKDAILDEQIRKLTTMLDLIVNWLDLPERLVPVLKQLGARHHTYGVHDDHYGKVGTALIVLYVVSPIDLIPDVLPVIGVVDDLVLVPLAIRWLLNRLPPEIAADCNRTSFFTQR